MSGHITRVMPNPQVSHQVSPVAASIECATALSGAARKSRV